MLSIDNGALAVIKVIKNALETDNGALIGRNGQIELDLVLNEESIDSSKLQILERNAGIYPITQAHIFYRWRDLTKRAILEADVLATGWYEPLKAAETEAFEKWLVSAIQIPLRSLEPYYVDPKLQWTALLSGHKVAVVSSFTQSAKAQIKNGYKGTLPPDVDWQWIQTGHPRIIAMGRNEWPPHIHSWIQAADYVVASIVESGARFALIGCGGLGMPIAKMLKDRGIIAIVLGGAIQVLFGIKGRRWENHPIISMMWTDDWVWPSEEETPGNANIIEGGCYWR